MARKKSVVVSLGCSQCEWFSPLKNCIKFGISNDEINEGRFVHTIDHGGFHLNKIKNCPIKAPKKINTASEKELRATQKKLLNIGLVG
jgi:hypothetical protein